MFVPALLMVPKVKKVPAELFMNGIAICSGTLVFDEYNDNELSYTFVGAEFEDVVSGLLSNIEWPEYSDIEFSRLVEDARSGRCRDFALPQIMRKSFAGANEYRTSTDNKKYPACSATDKYANYLATEYPFIVPAVHVSRILEKTVPGLEILGYDLNRLISQLAILAPFKSKLANRRFGVIPTYYGTTRPSETTPPYKCDLDLANSMPDMPVADFIANLLKMTCSTLFCNGRNYQIRANRDIIASSHIVDWTDKVADTYTCAVEEGQGYSFSFQSIGNDYQATNPDDPEQLEESPIPVEVSTMMEAIDTIRGATNIVSMKYLPTEDIISGTSEQAYLYYRNIISPGVIGNSIQWQPIRTAVPISDIAHQAGFEDIKFGTENTTQRYDCSVAFLVPPCVPTEVFPTSKILSDGSIQETIGLCSMTPIVELPAVGANKTDTVHIGLLLDNNFVDKGIYFTRPIMDADSGSERVSDLTLALNGNDGLFETYHRQFAEWLRSPKNPRSIELNLTTTDVAQFRLFNKYMMCNRLWIVKSLELILDTSDDSIQSTAEVVPV